jgi:hypothetical protein
MKTYLAVATILCGSFLVHAQTPLHKQAPGTSDICANSVDPMQNSDIYSCAMDAMSIDNYRIALKWFLKGASRGDSSAQFQLGKIYEDGNGVPIDFVQAYKWFDIAAATHGACIDQLPPGGRQEDNHMEIKYRDSVARKMTEPQIKEAQRLAREWKPSVFPWKYQPSQFNRPNYTPPTYVPAKSWCDED